MDNTFAGFHNHGGYAVDIFLHSLTKYASGHGDVMGGAIISSDQLIAGMRKDVVSMGPTLDPHAAFLIQRGLRTYFLRYERECANALAVAEFLRRHARIKRVFHPGLEGHPQHLLAKRQMKDFGAVVSFELNGGFEEGNRFADALELFSTTSSVGSTESLVMPPQLLGGQEDVYKRQAEGRTRMCGIRCVAQSGRTIGLREGHRRGVAAGVHSEIENAARGLAHGAGGRGG